MSLSIKIMKNPIIDFILVVATAIILSCMAVVCLEAFAFVYDEHPRYAVIALNTIIIAGIFQWIRTRKW